MLFTHQSVVFAEIGSSPFTFLIKQQKNYQKEGFVKKKSLFCSFFNYLHNNIENEFVKTMLMVYVANVLLISFAHSK